MSDARNCDLYDAVVIGGGPAGLTAALYLARAKCRVLVLEKEQFGGQIAITEELVNYPGVERIGGAELGETMCRQAAAFGAEFAREEALELELDGDIKIVRTNRDAYRCFAVLLATGARARTVGFIGEEKYRGRGVSYCATCDGELFAGREVFVIGGGYAAAEESVFLARFARHVTVLIRGKDFSCAVSVAQPVRQNEKITVLTSTVLEEVSGENGIDYVRCRNTADGSAIERRCNKGELFGVFVFAGYEPAAELVRGCVKLDEKGCIVADDFRRTEVEGVYAAGDVCAKTLRQVVTAAGDGAIAAVSLEKYACSMRRKTGLQPNVPEKAATGGSKADAPAALSEFFTEDTVRQMREVFARMEKVLQLRLYLDQSENSRRLEKFASELCELSDKLTVVRGEADVERDLPCIAVFYPGGEATGIAFHGVPAGHELGSFALALYNAAGPGQRLSEEQKRRIAELPEAVEMKILVTLSCSMCPDLVVAAQHIAIRNPRVSAHVYDIAHFPALREQYNVMSVPCLVINGNRVFFGRKDMDQLLELLER